MSSADVRGDARIAIDYDPFAEGEIARVVPLTEPQREIWLASQIGREASLAFNESVSLRLRGRLDRDALQLALQSLLDRHVALRSNIDPDGETMCVLQQAPLDLKMQDLSALATGEREQAVRACQRQAVEMPFDLEHDRLFRAQLLRMADDEHILVLTAHHIVCDGWSWWVLTRELGALYARASGAPGESLPDADDYAAYALAEASRRADAADEEYWLSRFADEVPVLDLPLDHPRPPSRSFASAREDYELDGELVAAIRQLGARRGASLFATLLASFATLLSRLTGQSRVVVGIPAAGQSLDGHDHLVGHCVNTLPLLFEIDLAQPVARAIDEAQATLLDAIEHQRYTFGTLLTKLNVRRDPSRLPLINVMFNIDQALDGEHAAFPGLQMEFSSNPRAFENFELFVNAVQAGGKLRLECQYNTDMFNASTVRHWMGYWRTMLEAMVADALLAEPAPLGRLPLLAEIERRQVLEKWNGTRAERQEHRLVHELFEAQVAATPDAPAVAFQDTRLTYEELNKRANRLARRLREAGLCPDDRVALCVERGVEMVVGMLGVLKAGGAYVPLDPVYPSQRLRFMVEDSDPRLLLVQAGLATRIALGTIAGDVAVMQLDAAGGPSPDSAEGNLPRKELSPSHLAYVIYTSGSTGKPKGVMVEHAGLSNYLDWAVSEYQPRKGSVVSSSFAFDATVTSLFAPLLCGGLVRIVPEKEEIEGLLAEMTRPPGCGLVKITPAHLEVLGKRLQSAGGSSNVDVLVVGGEALPAPTISLWQQLQPGIRIINEYGPTETVVGCSIHDIPANHPGTGPVPIGRPISNMRIYILDAFMQPVPVGVVGEIYIGGAGVARGYLNRPELTRERFLQDHFARQHGARMYRSGDLGRWLADGNIEYLGRNDSQVKLRGFRVELGEIEQALALHPALAQSVVVTRQDRPGDVRLVAYAVPRAGERIDAGDLSRHLAASLPEYMVPQHFVFLEAIPLTANGKVDRKALPVPDVGPAAGSDRTAPRNDTERAIAEAMAQVLGLPEIGIHDDFFALGGHSLLAAQMTTRLNRDLGIALSLRAVFDGPTVAKLGKIADESVATDPVRRKPIERRSDQRRAPLSLVQERLRLLDEFNPGSLSYNAPSAHRLRGPLDLGKLDQAFCRLAQRQTVLRTGIQVENGAPVQVIHDGIDPGLGKAIDLSHLPADERESEVAARMRALIEVPFADLSQAPLFRACLFRMAEEEHVLFFMPHHIIWDGWSFDLMYAEIAELYGASVDGREPALPELPVTYGDYAAWHREWVEGGEYAAQLASWRERLARPNSQGGRPQALPTDKPRRRGMSGRSESFKVSVDADLTTRLHAVSRDMDVTLFVTLLAAYYVSLAHCAGQRDMVIGTPVRGRNSSQVEGLMGYFTNLLPLRMEVDPSSTFVDTVRKVREVVLDSFAAPDIRLEDLASILSLRSEGGGGMLYQALFSFQDIRQRVVRWGALEHSRIEVFQHGATEDLGLWFVESTEGMSGGLIYNADILDDETVLRMRQRYLNILHAVSNDPRQSIAALMERSDRTEPGHEAEPPADRRNEAVPADPRVPAEMPAAIGSDAAPGPGSREQYLLDMWSQLFGIEVKSTDNFFDLGGNSMLAVQMSERVARDTGHRIKLMKLAVHSAGEIAAELPASGPWAGNDGIGGKLARGVRRLFGG